MAKNYLSIKQVRETVFNGLISESLILKLINKKEIPSRRYGGRILIPIDWVEKTLKEARGDQNE